MDEEVLIPDDAPEELKRMQRPPGSTGCIAIALPAGLILLETNAIDWNLQRFSRILATK